MYRMGKEEIDAVARVIESRSLFRVWSKYEEVNHFENELSTWMGVDNAVCVNSGTSALTIALAGLGVGPGDEVIVPAYTFMATAVAVLAVGAIPVIAEIDNTFTMDVKDVEKKLSAHTKAVIPVHMCGFPCNMDPLMALSKQHGFYVLEDACQAVGGTYHGTHLGTIGNVGAFSFNFFKIISAGEGGAMVTNDFKLYERALIYQDCGIAYRPYRAPVSQPLFTGANMRVSEITGAILRVQLQRLDGILHDLREIHDAVSKALPNAPFAPSNDTQGDCMTKFAFLFDTAEQAKAFEAQMAGYGCYDLFRPIDSEKHNYSNWKPILEHRGAFCAEMNPYENPLNSGLQMNYTKDMCARSLDLLERSVLIENNCDWTKDEVAALIERIGKALRSC